ncbi:MAG: DUF2852 domain-containing protein [Maritimibacter sp.]
MSTATHSGTGQNVIDGLKRVENWLNERGSAAWIASSVLGFIFFWPLGMIILFYWLFFRRKDASNALTAPAATAHNSASSNNIAFESYKQETIARLADEQDQFESFLDRLRAARDKQEFDHFLDQRADAARDAYSSEDYDDEDSEDGNIAVVLKEHGKS